MGGLIAELARLTEHTSYYKLSPGRLDAMLHLVETSP